MAPASCLAWAAASARSVRRSGSAVSAARALQERGRRREAAARLRPAGGALELGGDLLVRAGGRLRAVPRAAVRILPGIRRLGQRAVHRAPLAGRAPR